LALEGGHAMVHTGCGARRRRGEEPEQVGLEAPGLGDVRFGDLGGGIEHDVGAVYLDGDAPCAEVGEQFKSRHRRTFPPSPTSEAFRFATPRQAAIEAGFCSCRSATGTSAVAL